MQILVGRCNGQGVEGIKEGYRSGRPCTLTAAHRPQFHDTVDSGSVACGLSTGVCTSPSLGGVLQEEFGIAYHPGHMRKLLHRLGGSMRPTTRLVQPNPAKQNKWIRYTYPALKKRTR